MSVIDRVESAKYTLTGSGISKAISKATSHEVIGPKKKHLDYVQNALQMDNVSIPSVADMLFERCGSSSWVVVFKSLVTFHHLMANANERFIQYVASRSATWMLHNFFDKGGVQGYDMSHVIRRYSSYLTEKAYSYRTIGYDFCRVARGKEDGILRNLETSKLLKALSTIQSQLDALVATSIASNELTNGIVTAAFMLLFKDIIRLFACYNDGIINLLEKFFEMKKPDCKTALEIYKRFLARMDRVSEFLKIAEDAGIEKGDIPDLTKAPSSLLDALTSHYQSLEKGKSGIPAKLTSLPAFNFTQSQPVSTSLVDGKDDQYLEQERKMLAEFERKKKETELKKSFHEPSTFGVATMPATQNDSFTKPSDDLLLLSPNPLKTPNTTYFNDPFNTITSQNTVNADFSSAFKSQQFSSTPNLLDSDILAPERSGCHMESDRKSSENRILGDVDQGLERAALSLDDLNISSGRPIIRHQWTPQQMVAKTGGANFHMSQTSYSTIPQTTGNFPVSAPMMGVPNYNPNYNTQMQMPYRVQQPGMFLNYNTMYQQQQQTFMPRNNYDQMPPKPFSNNQSLF